MQLIRGAFAVALFSVTAFVACGGGSPGGSVGDACNEIGDNDPACLADEICETIQDGERFCLFICEEQSDCDVNEDCNGTSKGSTKACHPKFECDLDDPDC